MPFDNKKTTGPVVQAGQLESEKSRQNPQSRAGSSRAASVCHCCHNGSTLAFTQQPYSTFREKTRLA